MMLKNDKIVHLTERLFPFFFVSMFLTSSDMTSNLLILQKELSNASPY